MCKEGWCVELGQEGVSCESENCLKYPKREWKGKEGRGNKDFKKGGQACSRGGCLKNGEGGWIPLTNYNKYIYIYIYILYCM